MCQQFSFYLRGDQNETINQLKTDFGILKQNLTQTLCLCKVCLVNKSQVANFPCSNADICQNCANVIQ